MARDWMADLEGLAGGAVALGREVATPILGAGRYINDMMYGIEDASNAMDWARAEMAGVKLDVSPAARKSQQDIAQAVVEPASRVLKATGLQRLAESEVVQAAGRAWEDVSEDTKAGLEMALAGLDLNPGMAAVAAIPKMAKGVRYAENAMDLAAGLPLNPAGYGRKVPPQFKHQVSKTNLERPFDDLTSAVIELNTAAPERVRRFGDMVNPGDVLIPLLGDTTRADALLTHVNDAKLRNPVMMQGGPGYARTHLLDPLTGKQRENPFGWASGTGVTTSLTNRGLEGLAASPTPGAKVRGVYTTMSPRGAYFSRQVGDSHIERVKLQPLSNEAKDAFDEDLNKMIDVANKAKLKDNPEAKTIPKWVGQNKRGWEQQLKKNTELRKLWLDANSKKAHERAGFPDMASTLKANIEPSMIHTPNMMSGGMISRMDVHKGVDTVPELHDSYPSHMPGVYQGRLANMVPAKDMFRTYFQSPEYLGGGGSPQYMLDRVKPYQLVDDQLLETISALEDALLAQGRGY
jgi:hypothetical protein